MPDETKINYKFSGHETFPCRYAWLPKAVAGVESNPDLFSDEDEAMVELGVGKNMVRSIRFWAEAADIIRSSKNGHQLTSFGRELLFGKDACDPYLEDIRTLWLIHWKLATNPKFLIFSWHYLLNHFHEPELYASAVLNAFEKTARQVTDKAVSIGSLEQLFDIFLHSYVPTRGKKGQVKEDNLDCPLVELNLLRHTGMVQSTIHKGNFESKFVYRREEKPEISPALFAYCMNEFWNLRHAQEQSIPFHIIVVGENSPGQVFKIPEPDIRDRLFGIDDSTKGFFYFDESATIPQVIRKSEKTPPRLKDIYSKEWAYA